ncbi:MAG: hypothetical protein IPK16_12650 [Anaerolineales bacterium]|nr:hypothetical protein [Anaerolineales bacterium]
MLEALLDAFDLPSLCQLVRTKLDEDLYKIAGGKNNREIVFSLLSWAERHRRLADLVRAAAAANPRNELLQRVAKFFDRE